MSLSLDKNCRAAWNFCLKFVPKIKIWSISRLMKIQYLSCAICWTMSAKFFLFLYFLLLFVCCFIFHFYVLLIILVLFFRLSLFQCFLQEKTSQNECHFWTCNCVDNFFELFNIFQIFPFATSEVERNYFWQKRCLRITSRFVEQL